MPRHNFLAEIGRLLIEFQLEQMKNAGDSIRQDSMSPATETNYQYNNRLGDSTMSAARKAKTQ